MLSTGELEEMRATVTESLPQIGEVLRLTPVADGRGGTTTTWAVISSGPWRIAPENTTGSEQPADDRMQNVQRWIATGPAGTNIGPTDRLRIGASTFEVKSVRSPRSYELSTRVGVVEVT